MATCLINWIVVWVLCIGVLNPLPDTRFCKFFSHFIGCLFNSLFPWLYRSFFPMFSSGNFMVSDLAFKPVVYFKLTFVYGVNFDPLHGAII